MSQYGENQSTGSKVTGALGSLFGAGKKPDNNNPSSDYGSAAPAAPHDGSYDQRNNTRGGGGSGPDSAGPGPGATNMQQPSNQESHQQQQQQRQAYNGTPQGGTGPTSGQQQQHGRFDQPAGAAYGNQAGQEQLGYGGGGGGVVYQGLDRGGGGGGYGTHLGGPQDKYAAAAAPPNSGVANQGAGYNGMQQGPQAGYGAPMSAANGNPEAGYGMQQGPQAGYGAPMGGAGGNPGAGYGAPIWRGGGGGGGGGNQGGASFQSQPGYGTLTRESQAPYQEAAGSYQPQPSGYGTQGTQAPNQGAQGYQPQGVVGDQGGPGQGPPTGYEKDENRDRPNNQQQQQGQPGAGGGFPVDSGYGNTAAIAPGLFITISQKVPGQQGGDAAYASSYPYQGGNQAPNQGGQLQGGANPRGMEPSSGSGAANAFGNQAPSQGMGQQQHHDVGFGGIPQYGTLQGGGRQQGPPNPVSDAFPQMTAPYGFQDGPRRYQEQQGGTAPAGALAAGVGAAGLAGPHGNNNTGYYGQHATTAANHQPSQDTGAGKEQQQQQQQFSGDNLENTQPGATGTTQSATPGAGSDTPQKPSLGEQIKEPDNNTAGNAPSEDNTNGAPDSSSGLPQSDGAGKGTSTTTTPTPTSSTTKAAGTGDESPMPDYGTSGDGTTSDVGKKKSGGLVGKIKNKLHI
jgi:hypothetical protein